MKTKSDSITIEMMLNASIKKVWSAWTSPEQVLRWFGSDPNGIGIHAILDVRVGGKYEITFQDSDHSEHTCSGQYREVIEFNKLTFTWMWKSEPDVESVVTMLLIPHDDRTQMHFEHAHVGTESMHNYLIGWKGAFAKLERMLEG